MQFLKERLIQPDFDTGNLPVDIHVDALKERYAVALVDRLVRDEEWEAACHVACRMRDGEVDRRSAAIQMSDVLARYKRYPTVERVAASLGPERAGAYRAALERVEMDDGYRGLIPDERFGSPWRKPELEAVVSLMVDVVAPHIGDEAGMAAAFEWLVESVRSKRRERAASLTDSTREKRALAKSLGIWLPVPGDMERWKTDPRTRDKMREFLPIMEEVVRRLRMVRSYLQYIPRRRICDKTISELPENLARMKAYLRGIARALKKQV